MPSPSLMTGCSFDKPQLFFVALLILRAPIPAPFPACSLPVFPYSNRALLWFFGRRLRFPWILLLGSWIFFPLALFACRVKKIKRTPKKLSFFFFFLCLVKTVIRVVSFVPPLERGPVAQAADEPGRSVSWFCAFFPLIPPDLPPPLFEGKRLWDWKSTRIRENPLLPLGYRGKVCCRSLLPFRLVGEVRSHPCGLLTLTGPFFLRFFSTLGKVYSRGGSSWIAFNPLLKSFFSCSGWVSLLDSVLLLVPVRWA